MSQIGHDTDPTLSFVDLCGQLTDITIAAALLAQSGAAWDGDKSHPLRPQPDRDSPEYAAWSALRDSPEGRVLHIELAGHHKALAQVRVIKAGGWHGYKAGELAPMPRVFYHLRGRYEFYHSGALVRRVPWTADDFRFWVGEFYRPGGLMRAFERQFAERNRLLNVNRDCYQIESRAPLATPQGDVWEG